MHSSHRRATFFFKSRFRANITEAYDVSLFVVFTLSLTIQRRHSQLDSKNICIWVSFHGRSMTLEQSRKFLLRPPVPV